MKNYDIIVIGGGISGLSTGAFFSQKGFKVLIVEKQKEVGGYLSTFRRGEFKFEAAVHYTYEGYPGGIVPRMLKMLGIENEIELIRIGKTQKTYNFYFPDFEISLAWNKEEFINSLCTLFPNEKNGIRNYFLSLENGFKKIMEIILERSIKLNSLSLDEYLKYESEEFCKKFDIVVKEIGFDSLTEKFVSRFIKNEKLLSLLLFVPPIPNHTVCQTALNWWVDFSGLYAIKGGIDLLPKKLKEKIIKSGGEILLNTSVTKLIIDSNRIKGIVTENGEEIYGNFVISSIDVHQLFGNLIPEEKIPLEYKEKIKGECIPSNFVVYLGIDKDLKELGFYGESIYVFPDYNTKKVLEDIHKDLWPENNPVKIVTISALDNENNFASKGKSVLILHSTAPYSFFYNILKKSTLDYKKVKEKITNQMIETVKRVIPDIEKYILFKEAATPVTFEKFTGNHLGSMMGWMPTKNPFLLSQFNSMKTFIDHLYLNGHWVYPGCGISNCLLGSYLLSKLILKEANLQ